MLAGLSQCWMVNVPPGLCAKAGPAPATAAARTALAKTTRLLPNITFPPARAGSAHEKTDDGRRPAIRCGGRPEPGLPAFAPGIIRQVKIPRNAALSCAPS